ncbi:hypothetical protein SFC55_20880 [Niallia taxi]|uniref:hypothetical protein n=1 Tax=Niallia taxi TaxID=2499688 RepID=UPI0039823B56
MATLGTHETLEIHELLTFKSLCLTKSSTMSNLVQDEELKRIINQDAALSTKHIQSLQNFMTKGGIQ